MKIAIAVENKETTSQISPLGARAPYYLIFDDKKLVETIKNPFAVGSGGAGPSVAYMLAEKGVSVIFAQKVGPNMEGALINSGIKYVEVDDSKNVGEIIENY